MPARTATPAEPSCVQASECDGQPESDQGDSVVEVEEATESFLEAAQAVGDLEGGGLFRSGCSACPRVDGGAQSHAVNGHLHREDGGEHHGGHCTEHCEGAGEAALAGQASREG